MNNEKSELRKNVSQKNSFGTSWLMTERPSWSRSRQFLGRLATNVIDAITNIESWYQVGTNQQYPRSIWTEILDMKKDATHPRSTWKSRRPRREIYRRRFSIWSILGTLCYNVIVTFTNIDTRYQATIFGRNLSWNLRNEERCNASKVFGKIT
jgi:hypothetical protein